jgi:4-aminobutyrate aminotransferase-like enzyme
MFLGAHSEKVQQKIEELFSAIIQEQSTISTIKPPDPDKTNLVANRLEEYKSMRSKPIFYNYLSSGRGHGPFTELIDGSIKYDLIGGIGVYLLGHSHPLHIKSNLEAATFDEIMVGNLQPYIPAIEFNKKILKAVDGSKLKYFWFGCSGSFSNDTALKLIWQKKAPHYKVIAFTKAFAGRSVATQSITYNEEYREGMPQTVHTEYVPHYDQKNPSSAITNTLQALNEVWQKDPGNYCAITMELVQGEGGFIFGPKEWYEAVFKWAKEKNLYIWIDEVQTFGRTGQLFAFQEFGLENYVDILTVGKALQVCGVLFSEELNPKPGLIAGTFNGSLSAIIMANKTLDYLISGNFFGELGRVKEIGLDFTKRLEALKEKLGQNKIGFISSKGVMIAFEIGQANKIDTEKFIKKLFDNGVITFNAGKDPMRVRLLLPISITKEHIDEIFVIIENTIKQVFGE